MHYRKKNTDRAADTVSVKEAMEALLKQYKLQNRYDEATLATKWEEAVGGPIAKHTLKVFAKNRTLFLELDSPALKHELTLKKSLILAKLSAAMGGREVVDDIHFL